MNRINVPLAAFLLRPVPRQSGRSVRCYELSGQHGETWRQEYRTLSEAKAAAEEHAGGPVKWTTAARDIHGRKTERGYVLRRSA